MSIDDARQFADLAMVLHGQATTIETIEVVVQSAVTAVGCRHASVMLIHGRDVSTAVATDEVAAKADELQLAVGEGPCLEAVTGGHTYRIDDTQDDQRWPRWSPLVAELGVRSVLSMRLGTTGARVGALNLFDPEPRHFDTDDAAVGQVLARHAAIALTSAQQVHNLWTAIDARKLIGQAQGILMERFNLDAARAFAVLRRYSQDNNIKLRVVAQRLIDTRQLPRPSTPPSAGDKAAR